MPRLPFGVALVRSVTLPRRCALGGITKSAPTGNTAIWGFCLRNPDPPTRLDLIDVRDPRVGLEDYTEEAILAVNPLSDLGQRVPRLDVVPEASVKGKLYPHARADRVGVLADHGAVGQPYAAPIFLASVTKPSEGNIRQVVPFLHVVPSEPIVGHNAVSPSPIADTN